MPLKRLSLRQYCSSKRNISSFITLSSPLYGQINEDLAVCWSSFIFANNVPQQVLTWQRDAILLIAWPKYLHYFRRVKMKERETERGVKIETILRNLESIWHIWKVWQITAMAPDQRIFQMNQALDRQSHYAVQPWHISGYNLYANILHLFSQRPLWVSVNVSEGQF